MFREEDEQMQSLGLAPQTQITPTPQLGQQPIQAASASAPATQPTTDMLMAQATPTDLRGMTFSAEELGLGDQDPAPISDPEPVRDQPSTPSLTFSSEDLGIEEATRMGIPTPEEPRREVTEADDPQQAQSGLFLGIRTDAPIRDLSRGAFDPVRRESPDFDEEPTRDFFGVDDEGEPLAAPVADEDPVVDPIMEIPKDEFVQWNSRFYEQYSNFQEALDIYEQFEQNDHTEKNVFGLLVQTNPDTGVQTMIFPPEQPNTFLQWINGDLMASPEELENFGISVGTKAWASLYGTLGNLADFAGEVTEFAGSPFGLFQDQREATSRMFARFPTEGVVDQTIDDGVRLLAFNTIGAAIALKAMEAITKSATLKEQFRRTYFGGGVGEAVTASEDLPPIFIGEDAALDIPILRDIDITDPGTAARQLQNRVSIAAEAFGLSKAFTSTAQKSKETTEFLYGLTVKPLLLAFKKGDAPIEAAAFNKLVDKLFSVERDGVILDPFQRSRLVSEIADIVEENSRVILPSITGSGGETVELIFDTMAAIERGLSPEDLTTLMATLRGIRTGQISSGGPLTLTTSTQPTRVLQEQIGGRIQDVGGPTSAAQIQAMRESAEGFADQGRQVVRGALDEVRIAEEALEEATNTLIADLARGGGLAAELQRLTNALPTEIPITRNTAREDIRRLAEEGIVAITARKNELFSRFSGGEIDSESLLDVLMSVNINELSKASQSIASDNLLRGLRNIFAPDNVAIQMPSSRLASFDTTPPAGRTEGAITREEAIENANAFFARNPEIYNYGFFYTEIRPELSRLASEFYSRNMASNGDIIRKIIRTIDEDMFEYAAARDPVLRGQRDESFQFYTDVYAPLAKDGPLKELASLYEATIRRGGMRPVDFESGSRNIIERILVGSERGPDTSQINQLKRLLDRPELAGDSGLIPDFFMAEAALGASRTLRESAGTAVDLSTYRESLISMSEALRDNFPMQARELDDFYLQVERVKNNRVALEEVVEKSQERLKQIVEEVSQSELRAFFAINYASSADPVLARFATVSDPAPAFKSLFTQSSAETTQRLTAIMNRIDAAPPEQREVLLKGLETAYLRTLRDNMIGRSPDATGALNVLNSKIQNNIEEVDTLFAAGLTVYRDKPEIMFTLITLASEASQTDLMRRAVAISGMSPTEFNRQAAQATSRLIYTTVGPLTRIGTRIRAATTAALESAAPDQRAIRIWDRIVADGDYFVELARRYNRAPSLDKVAERALIQTFLAPQFRAGRADLEEGEARMLLLQRLPEEGLGSPAPPFSPGRLLDTAAQTEMMLRDTSDSMLQRIPPEQ